MRNLPLTLALLCTLAEAFPAQAREGVRSTRFQDHPAGSVYKGASQPAKLRANAALRGLRAHQRATIAEEARKRPNFAGAYRLVTIGCGTACQSIIVIDLRNGRVYAAPKPASAGVTFRLDSRLIRINADPTYKLKAAYYVFDKGRFRAVK